MTKSESTATKTAIAYASPDDLTDDGQGRIRIHDVATDEQIDVIEYTADDDEDWAWANIADALDDAGYRVTTDWTDSAADFRGPRAQVVPA